MFMVTMSSLSFAEKVALWEQNVNAQVEYQKQVADLSLKEAPDLEEIIIINRDLQTTMYEMKREQYIYLIAHHPERLQQNKGLNFDWLDEDEKTLLESSKHYKILKEKKEALKAKNQGHPMWPALRKSFLEIRKTKEYIKIHNSLMGMLKT